MSRWEEKHLGDICDSIYSGGTPKSTNQDYYNGNIPWLNTNEVNFNNIYQTNRYISSEGLKNSAAKYVPENTVIVAMYGVTAGKCAVAKIPLTTNQACCNLVINNKIADYRYVFQYLRLNSKTLNGLANGGAQQNLNSIYIKKFKIWIPDLSTQKRIADILSAYDELIENNNRRIALMDQMVHELYNEWFVRFRFPGHKNVKFEHGLPMGWKMKNIGQLCDVTSSKRVYLADYVEEGIPFYRSKEIIQLSQGLAVSDPLYISESAFNAFKNKFGVPKRNDILITSVGTIGVSYLVDGHEFYFKDGNLTWIKSGDYPQLTYFLFQWLNSKIGKQQLLQSTIGTSQSALTIENLKKIKVVVPSEYLIEEYYNHVFILTEQKRVLQFKNQNLAKQQNLLLPRLMSGKLEV